MNILGIETSCDETSAAVVQASESSAGIDSGFGEKLTILSNVIASQTDLHDRFGGVVPEIASRRHVELIIATIQEALDQAGAALDDIDCIGVINRPGLIGALIVGVAAAKSIAYARGIPLVPVHHLEAHIYANWLLPKEKSRKPGSGGVESRASDSQPSAIDFPVVCLVVSGGHSDLILMTGHGEYEILARTVDDAAGEAFDKCARAMGLGYPGGPLIDKQAKTGNPHAIAFPRGKVGDSLDFTFSGLKTAVIRYVESRRDQFSLPDLAASFQEAVVDVLVEHTFRAVSDLVSSKSPGGEIRKVLLAGGVAANSRLQAAMRARAAQLGVELIAPPPVLCTDNAAMAAAAAFFRYERGEFAGLDLDCYATEPLGTRRSS
ncbi:MAG: tRNA (adenosine(37)-N6)-threonylcarbamoyltransferase complex transferase subunit TsaD [Armatimonadetes bacterium]|nr:tRNA (adenosine(37)-N6)-threonylcarbamoyltransferase complex transferase subunit TsaD [Armatimonadota bacterium]